MGHEYKKFDKLEKDYKQLLGRKSTLVRMIEKRNKELLPLVKEVKKLRNEIEGFEEELDSLKLKIKEISIGEKWEPPIVITKVKNVKGYDYLTYIRFTDLHNLKVECGGSPFTYTYKYDSYSDRWSIDKTSEGSYYLSEDQMKTIILMMNYLI